VRYFNSAAIIGAEGLMGSYRKIHLPYLGVDRFLQHGDRPFQVFDTKVGRIGLAICYDGSIPESVRVLALDGAEIIASPMNWPEGAEPAPQYVVNARCYENRVNFIASNRTGCERGHRFIGRSKIVNYAAETLAEATADHEEIIYADTDPLGAQNKRLVKDDWYVDRFRDRRPQFYQRLMKEVK